MLRRKKVPDMWYTQGPAERGVRPEREGPFTREAILELWSRGSLGGDVLVWTNEKLFPNPDNVRSSRKVRIDQWRRWAELPDPARRELEAQARALENVNSHAHVEEDAGHGSADYNAATDPYSVDNFVAGNSGSDLPPKISHGNIGNAGGFGGNDLRAGYGS